MLLKTENKFDVLFDEDSSFEWDPLDSLDLPEIERLEISSLELGDIFKDAVEVMEDLNLPLSIHKNASVYGMEVGDDRVDISRCAYRLSLGLICQERVLKMVTSPEDTTISNSIWNFCEISNGIPTDQSEMFDFCRKNQNFANLAFVDSAPLRIILDVSKGDGSHSSTASGKAAMLGTRMRTPRDRLLRPLQTASFIQDGMLRTSMSSDPKYLPRIMGGSGVRALFDNADNIYLYSLAYKAGRCNRIYGSATRELQDCLRQVALSRPSMPVLCRMLGDRQEYLHGTYSNMIFAPKLSYKDSELERLPMPLIEATGGANKFNASLNRLVRTRHLVTRTVALREWEYTKTIRDRLLTRAETTALDYENTLRKGALRKKFGSALNANTAFAHLLERRAQFKDAEELMRSEYHVTISSGSSAFTIYDAQWIFSGGKYEDYSIEDLTITEDLHSREDVSEEQTFKVGGLTLSPIVGLNQRRVRTTTRIGLYQINKSMEEWADDLHRRLLSHREDGAPIPRDVVLTEVMRDPEWVNDDSGLIGLCLQHTRELHQRSARVVLVSADKRLANQMSNTCNVQVERLPPLPYILAMLDEGLDPIEDRDQALTLLADEIPSRERADPIRQFYVDTGSVASVLSNMEEQEQDGIVTHRVRERLGAHSEQGSNRTTNYILRDIPDRIRSFNTTPIRPVLRDRRFYHRASGRPPTVSSKSWRTASTAD